MANQKYVCKSDIALQKAENYLNERNDYKAMKTIVDFITHENSFISNANNKVIAFLIKSILPPLTYEEDYSVSDYEHRIGRLRNFAKAILGIPEKEDEVPTGVTEETSKTFVKIVEYVLSNVEKFRPKKEEIYYEDVGEKSLYFIPPGSSDDVCSGSDYWPALHRLVGPSPLPARLYVYQLNQAIRMINILFQLNKHWGSLFGQLTKNQIVPDEAFHKIQFFRSGLEFNALRWNREFQRNQPFLFPPDFRQRIYLAEARSAYYGREGFPLQSVSFRASRSDVLQVAEEIASNEDVYYYWLFKFDNEQGEGLGPTREFYTKFSQEVGRRDLDLWIGEPLKTSDGKEYVSTPCGLFPSPCSQLNDRSRNVLIAVGRLMAKSVLDGITMDLHFSKALYKYMVEGAKNTQCLNLNDLKDVTPWLVKFVEDLLEVAKEATKIDDRVSSTSEERRKAKSELKCGGCSFEDLCINFTVPGFPAFEMVEGGVDRFLSADDVEEYLRLLVWWLLHEGPREKLECIREGFESVVDSEFFDRIDAEDFEKLLCGTGEKPWTVEELTKNCFLCDKMRLETALTGKLFKALSSFSREEQKLFLKFVTGSPNLPVGGFASLNPKLSIFLKHTDGNPDRYLPTASTCVHQISIPKYTKANILRKKLLVAIKEGQNSMDVA